MPLIGGLAGVNIRNNNYLTADQVVPINTLLNSSGTGTYSGTGVGGSKVTTTIPALEVITETTTKTCDEGAIQQCYKTAETG